jgi:DNA-binding NarL/FixJ family response regulator
MPSRSPITVVVGHFPDLLALGLRAVLAEDPSVAVVAEAVAYAGLPAVLRAHRPAVALLDRGALPDLAAVRRLSIEHPQTRLVLLGDALSAAESAQLLAFGASATLTVDTQARDVRHALHLASRGLQLMPIGAGPGVGSAPDPRLTAREGDVLLLLREGRTNAQIALALQIGVETVRTHARHVYRKLGVASRRALLALPAPPAAAPSPPRAGAGRRPTAQRTTPRRPLHR